MITGLPLLFSSSFQIQVKDKSGCKYCFRCALNDTNSLCSDTSPRLDVLCGQSLKFEGHGLTSVKPCSSVPTNRLKWTLYEDAEVTVFQKFGDNDWSICHQEQCEGNRTYMFHPTLRVCLWFQSKSTETIEGSDRFEIDFSENPPIRGVRYDANGRWNSVPWENMSKL